MGATEGKPYAHYYAGKNGEMRLSTGCTRWVIKQTKRNRAKIIRKGKAPWQRKG